MLELFYMLTRNDQPYLSNFNFGMESVSNNVQFINNVIPGFTSEFLLLDSESFLLLDGTQFLLLGN